MASLNLQKIKSLIIRAALYYGQQLDDWVLQAYASDLEDIEAKDVERAFNQLRLEPKRWRVPLPAEIKHHLSPTLDIDTQAQKIVSLIFANLQPIGRKNVDKARGVVGELGWEVVRRMGGWAFLCNSDVRDRNTQYAQAREQARACLTERVVAARAHDPGKALPEIKQHRRGVPLSTGDILRTMGGPHGQGNVGGSSILAPEHQGHSPRARRQP